MAASCGGDGTRYGFAMIPGLRPRCLALTIGIAVVFIAGLHPAKGGNETLVPLNASWRFLATGAAAPSDWKQPDFDDSAWPSGAAKLGMGHADQTTPLPPPTVSPRVTVYFRRQFVLPASAVSYTGLLARLVCDSGAVIYLNGVEVGRIGMPDGEITAETFANREPFEGALEPLRIGSEWLIEGTNTLAVELHTSSESDLDLDFELELIGSHNATPAFVVRGPYLQDGAPEAVTVRWRTDIPAATTLFAGVSLDYLDYVISFPDLTTEHEVRLTELKPDTSYFYAVADDADFVEGPGSAWQFRTPPAFGTAKPVRVWVLGDSGTGRTGQGWAEAVRDGYLNSPLYRPPDVWLMLGDNAYTYGSDDDYQNAVFDTFRETLRTTILWSTLGNHETLTEGTPYFSIFTLPEQGEGGGLASGTEHYYSFDYANIHFVCLDSQQSERAPQSPMLNWLEADLASTSQRWIIAFWHHPPYTKGTHDSDFEGPHIDMRENALPILEQYGVDLVLGGHSHVYERSFLIDGHYGYSWEWNASMLVDGGSGRANEPDGPYGKDPGSHQGAVYCVTGCSGQYGGGPLNHPVMFLSMSELGSLILDVNGDRLDAKFLNDQSVVRDHFTISKAPLVTISAPQPQMAEQGGTPGRVQLSRTREMAQPLAVQLALAGSATPGSDYLAPSLLAIIPAGMPTLDLDFPALADTLAEGTETIAVTLLAGDAYRLPKLARTVSLSLADRPIDDWRFRKFGVNANTPLIASNLADPDRDGQSNLFEYIAGTEPLSGASRFEAALAQNAMGTVVVRFLARTGRQYTVEYRSSFTSGAWQTLAIVPTPPLDQVVEIPDPAAKANALRFYRVRASLPQ
jgi:hypothetical protein